MGSFASTALRCNASFRIHRACSVARLEELTPHTAVKGVLPDSLVTVVATNWYGSEALELTYKDANGKLGSELLYRDESPRSRW